MTAIFLINAARSEDACCPTLLGATTLPVATVDVADFYPSKRINFVIGCGSGVGYDTHARLFARLIGEHIPAEKTAP